MRAWLFLLVAACGAKPNPPPVATPVTPAAAPVVALPAPPPAPATPPREYGPLSITTVVAEPTQAERDRLLRVYDKRMLDDRELHEDLAVLAHAMDVFLVPRTPELKTAFEVRDRDAKTLERLAPYSLASTMNSLVDVAMRGNFCIRAPGYARHCDVYFHSRTPQVGPAYEVSVLPSGIGQVVIRDLSSSAGWAGFAADVAKLAKAPGLVLDLRDARGGDPRPLIAWLEELTGRSPLAPLREIRRPAELAPYADAYRARFLGDAREPAAWAGLTGTAARRPHATRPIAIVVGAGCDSACELAARVLETYAGATVIGTVAASGRLHHDEPALLVLPHSGIEVYFHATEYVLNADIEAATGPTVLWHAWRSDEASLDVAVHEVTQRIAKPGWPGNCSSFKPYATSAALPPPVRAKIANAYEFDRSGCKPSWRSVHVTAHASLQTMQRLVESCGGHWISPEGDNRFSFGIVVGLPFVSRLAQSDLVEHIDVSCQHPPRPN